MIDILHVMKYSIMAGSEFFEPRTTTYCLYQLNYVHGDKLFELCATLFNHLVIISYTAPKNFHIMFQKVSIIMKK